MHLISCSIAMGPELEVLLHILEARVGVSKELGPSRPVPTFEVLGTG